MSEPLLYIKELAQQLRKSRTYVHAMKKAGFRMPGGTATLSEARDWLANHPAFSSTAYAKGKIKQDDKIESIDVDFSEY